MWAWNCIDLTGTYRRIESTKWQIALNGSPTKDVQQYYCPEVSKHEILTAFYPADGCTHCCAAWRVFVHWTVLPRRFERGGRNTRIEIKCFVWDYEARLLSTVKMLDKKHPTTHTKQYNTQECYLKGRFASGGYFQIDSKRAKEIVCVQKVHGFRFAHQRDSCEETVLMMRSRKRQRHRVIGGDQHQVHGSSLREVCQQQSDTWMGSHVSSSIKWIVAHFLSLSLSPCFLQSSV